MDKKVVYNIQSILVPKTHFKNAEHAAFHVKSVGLDPHFKEPHITDNYYKFKQVPVQEGGEYKTGRIDGSKFIYNRAGKSMGVHPHMYQVNTGGIGETKIMKAPDHNVEGQNKKDFTHFAYNPRPVLDGAVHPDHYKKATQDFYDKNGLQIAKNMTGQHKYKMADEQQKKLRRKIRQNQ